MSNNKEFKKNLYARVRIRPLIYYGNLDKYLDEEWIIQEINERWFRIHNPINDYFVKIGHDARREWVDDFSKQGGFKRGTILLKAQITLLDADNHVEPLTDSMLTEAMKRTPETRS
ncbi:MAG: hypothetical protein ACREV0_13140 [Burkholderiales bacterium]